ncbi:hypothetical protein CA54_60130 [Symmachiella macrocystis]|uniref:Uncharacterized protein n=1 Tax=Symmachiella macrocystis TaxID=2527985 RepID=A0A5C6AXC7_9PLAN|nr:hypothetical protein CA54_60130 [Symmachiella macrocystis]
MRLGIRDEGFTGFDIDEDQQKIVHDSPRRNGALREEVAGPERLGVHLDELFPRTLRAFGRRVDPLLFENVPNCLPTDTVDPQATQLTEDTRVPDTRFTSDLADQLTQYLPFSGASRLGRLVATSLLPDPAMKRAGGGDANQAVDVLAERFPEFEQPGTLFRLRVDFTGDASAKYRQFFFQILDMFGQSVFRGICDEQQQRVKQPGHPVPVCDFDKVLSNWEIALFLYPAGTCVTTIRRRQSTVLSDEKSLFVAQAVNQ